MLFKVFDECFFFLKQYKNQYIIAGGVKGFYFIDIEKFYAKSPDYARFFDRFNGFIGIECGQNGSCIDNKGHIWIPTSDKVVEFMPEKFKLNNNPPQTHIYHSYKFSSR